MCPVSLQAYEEEAGRFVPFQIHGKRRRTIWIRNDGVTVRQLFVRYGETAYVQLVENSDRFVHRRSGTLRSGTDTSGDETQTFVGTMCRTYADPSDARRIQGIRHRG